MATKTGDVKAISRVATALADIPIDPTFGNAMHHYVVNFVDGDDAGEVLIRAKVALRIAKLLSAMDRASRKRVLRFFMDQTSAESLAPTESPARKDGNDGASVIRHADGSERSV